MDKDITNFEEAPVWTSGYRPSAMFHVTGEDAWTFLQGQITQDLRSNTPGLATYGLWLNQKGKVLADSFVLVSAPDDVWLISLQSSAAVIQERLEAYIIADDVVVTDVTADWLGVAIGGPEAAAWLERQSHPLPASGTFVRDGGGFLFRGRRDGRTSYEWLLPSGSNPPRANVELSAEERERLRIAAGVPCVPQDVGPGDLPNEAGLDADAISYTKGCYLGQEVMARLKAMGTVRRRLVRVRGRGRGVPAVPAALLQGEKRVGELRSAVTDGAEGFIGLAMVSKLGFDASVPLAPEPGGEGFIEVLDQP